MVFTELEDRVVVLDAGNGRYCRLNSSASAVWRLVSEPITIQGLVEKLSDEFEVDQERCTIEVVQLLKDFEQRGWMREVT